MTGLIHLQEEFPESDFGFSYIIDNYISIRKQSEVPKLTRKRKFMRTRYDIIHGERKNSQREHGVYIDIFSTNQGSTSIGSYSID